MAAIERGPGSAGDAGEFGDGRVAGALCLECGMCCDGTLFQHGTLAEHEVGWALAHGFGVVRGDTGPAFRQPCPAFRDGCCSVYAERPRSCRAFRCRLLDDHEAGRRTFDECRAIVAEVRAAIAELEPTIGLVPGGYSRRRVAKLRTEAVRRDDLDGAEALNLAQARLDALLVEHFRA